MAKINSLSLGHRSCKARLFSKLGCQTARKVFIPLEGFDRYRHGKRGRLEKEILRLEGQLKAVLQKLDNPQLRRKSAGRCDPKGKKR